MKVRSKIYSTMDIMKLAQKYNLPTTPAYILIIAVYFVVWALIPMVAPWSLGRWLTPDQSSISLLIDIAIGVMVTAGLFFTHRSVSAKLFKNHWSKYLLAGTALLVVSVPIRAGGIDQPVFGNPAWLYILMSLVNVTMQQYATFGLLQSYLREKLSPMWTIMLTGMLFYATHAVLISHKFLNPLAALSIIALGLLFAAIRQKTGVLYITLSLHLAFFFVAIAP